MDEDSDFEQYEIELALRDSDKGKAIERFNKEDRKAAIQAAKDKVQWDLASMAGDAMDTLRMGLQSEDEGIRMKALSMYLDRMAPRVAIVKEETVIEVVDEAKKLSLGEIEELLRKKGMLEDGSN